MSIESTEDGIGIAGIDGIDISVTIFGVTFKNPVMGASGTIGYGLELISHIDLNELGAVVTKGISYKPRRGNPPPRLFETPSGLLNSIGLENIGAKRFIDEVLPELSRYDTRVIVNIFGETIEDYRKVAKEFRGVSGVDALEVNLSCPNVKEGGIAFGRDRELVKRVIGEVKGVCDLPVIAKLTPNVTDIVPIAEASQEAGADAISLINTILGMAIDVKIRKPHFRNVTAGLSGPAIRPVALRFVWETVKAVDIPVIGIGGIVTTEDVLEFIMAGAHAVQLGTAHFIDPAASIRVIGGLKKYLQDNSIPVIEDIRGIV